MWRRGLRAIGIVALGGAAIGLTGCLSAMIPTTGPTSTPGAVSPQPAPSPGGDTWRGGDLSLDDGATLDPATYIEWADGMAFSDAYELTSPDDGNGNWSYTHVATQCVAHYWQGTVTGFDLTKGDAHFSDEVLAQDFDETAESISPYAEDVAIGIQPSGTADARGIVGTNDDDTSYVVIARGFSTLGAALYFSLDCPAGQDAQGLFDEVRQDFSLSVTLP